LRTELSHLPSWICDAGAFAGHLAVPNHVVCSFIPPLLVSVTPKNEAVYSWNRPLGFHLFPRYVPLLQADFRRNGLVPCLHGLCSPRYLECTNLDSAAIFLTFFFIKGRSSPLLLSLPPVRSPLFFVSLVPAIPHLARTHSQ